ncbi:MAG: TolC family protein [Gemmatimonadales bacterium]
MMLLATLSLMGIAAAGPVQDTLRLETLQAAAQDRDPRARQLDLLEAQTKLRLRNLSSERLPRLTVAGEGTAQSDITHITLDGSPIQPPMPPKEQWMATIQADQLIYDGGTIGARRAVEQARLAESKESVRTAQYRLREEVNAAFFAAYLLQERDAELAAVSDDLEGRLSVVRARVAEGAALPADTASLAAEQLRIGQARTEASASRDAALAILARLTDRNIASSAVLALPDLAGATTAAAARDSIHQRPEFAQFARTRDRIASEAAVLDAERRPRVVAFGTGGYGNPGLNQFSPDADAFWRAGVRFEWRPWNWGTTARQREVLSLQREVIETEQTAFARSLERAVQNDLAAMKRLEATFQSDERIIALQQQVERRARAQLDEGVITAADYVEARTDVLQARLTAQRHRVELAQARARYLTTLGIEAR